MALSAGTRLGPYEILAPLGAGGMGEVYRARDNKLGRDVAVKILPPELAADPERRQRFEREARAASSLNHPSIVHVYDVDSADSVHYIAMELVQGRSLRELLSSGPLPTRKLLDLAIEMADGLAKAHAAGIVHRDLKPENLVVTPEGHVKILDFGLAKLAEPTTDDLSERSTVARIQTRSGQIMGTAGYMSPEQASGQAVDFRSDQFSLGVILYEMASGRRAFQGKSGGETLAAILRDQPEALSKANPSVPVVLRWIIEERCLAKDPRERYASTWDLLRELRSVREHLSEAAAGLALVQGARIWRRRWIGLAAAAAFIVFAMGLVVGRWTRGDRAPSRAPASFSVALPANAQAAGGLSPTIAISPDGTHLAYLVADAGGAHLYLRATDQIDGIPIPGTDGADGVFFSPDSRWLGFFADHKLKKVAVAGGPAVTLCDAGAPLGASWGPDDTIVFAAAPDAGLSRVSAAGGVPELLTRPDFAKGDSSYFWPEVLPGGKAVLFTALSSSGKSRIEVLLLPTAERHTLVDEGMNARYGAGYLVLSRAGALLAAPFDVEHTRVTGALVPVLDAVAPTYVGAAQFSLAADGTLLYVSGTSPSLDRALVWVSRAGVVQPIAAPQRAYLDPRIAPDGRRLVVEIYPGTNGHLWTYEVDRGALSRLTFDGFENETAVWIPGSERVAFSSSRAAVQRALFWKTVGESGGEEQLMVGDHHMHSSSASADGRFLAFTDYDPVTQGDIWMVPLTEARRAQPFLRTPFHEWGAVFSPDTHWIAYVSNESGRDEIYVQAFPGPGLKRQVSTEGGREPVWARSGQELFFRNGRKMMAVSITTGATLAVGKPHELFEGSYDNGLPLGHTNYDVRPDGQRFVMIQAQPQEAAARRVNVRLDWVQELRHRASGGR